MKKIFFFMGLIGLFGLLGQNSFSFAQDRTLVSMSEIQKIEKEIDETAFNILNSNGIERRMVFTFDVARTEDAKTSHRNRQITLYRGLYTRLSSTEELAAILAHEISHAQDSYKGIFKGYFSKLSTIYPPNQKKFEYKADKRAVDYLVNAGYNPVVLIVVLNKVAPQTRYDWYSSHPLTTRRTATIYEYIYRKYPEFLVNNKYKDNIFYQNFLLTSKENRKKFKENYDNNFKKSPKYL